jgi:hypothetical protein
MILDMSIVFDDKASKPLHVSVESIHADGIKKDFRLSVGEIDHTFSESPSDALKLITLGSRRGTILYTTLY